VFVARMATLLTLVLSLIATYNMEQVSQAWQFLIMLGAGTGLVYILRWYWWRINAWSEVAAMAGAFVVSLVLRTVIDSSTPRGFALNLIITTFVTTIIWLIATFVTDPEPRETLRAFYKKVRPAGFGWTPIAKELRLDPPPGELTRNAINWLLGVALVYSVMFGTGALIFHQIGKTLMFATAAVLTAVALTISMRREEA